MLARKGRAQKIWREIKQKQQKGEKQELWLKVDKVDFLHSQGLELGLLINQIMTTLFFTNFFFSI